MRHCTLLRKCREPNLLSSKCSSFEHVFKPIFLTCNDKIVRTGAIEITKVKMFPTVDGHQSIKGCCIIYRSNFCAFFQVRPGQETVRKIIKCCLFCCCFLLYPDFTLRFPSFTPQTCAIKCLTIIKLRPQKKKNSTMLVCVNPVNTKHLAASLIRGHMCLQQSLRTAGMLSFRLVHA